jgi:hypothetical protein
MLRHSSYLMFMNLRCNAGDLSIQMVRNFFLPDILFLIVSLHLAWFVISRNGVRSSFLVDFASMRTVCHESSLKLSTWPLSVSFKRVMRRSVFDQVGLFDSNTMRDILKRKKNIKLKNIVLRTTSARNIICYYSIFWLYRFPVIVFSGYIIFRL